MSTDKEKRETLGKFLEGEFIDFQRERGMRARIKDFADLVDMHPATMGQLMNGERLPDRKNLNKLGQRWPKVYEIMEVKFEGAQLPENPVIRAMVVDIIKHLEEHPEDIDKFDVIMRRLSGGGNNSGHSPASA